MCMMMMVMFFVGSVSRNLWFAMRKVRFGGGGTWGPFALVFPALDDCGDGYREVNGDGGCHSCGEGGRGCRWSCTGWGGWCQVVGDGSWDGVLDEAFVELGIEGFVNHIVEWILAKS